MADLPWITIVGLGEDGPAGLPAASLDAIRSAEIVMGPPRHLALLEDVAARCVPWPVPFAQGLGQLRGFAGQAVVVLASGDPFWFGAGSVIAREFPKTAWTCLPAPSSFAIAASRLGWALEKTPCLGLHAGPLTRLRPLLAPGARILLTLRNGAALRDLGTYLRQTGFEATAVTVLEALGGPRERIRSLSVGDLSDPDAAHPLLAALEVAGDGPAVPVCAGVPDALFETDGVMTKRAIRAVTLSSLAPKPGEMLWDIGGGSGSVSVEWLLSHPACEAVAVESRSDRVGLIRSNADRMGVDRLEIVQGAAPEVLSGLPRPDAVFVGGGLNETMMDALENTLVAGTRLVANAVTLEAENLLAGLHARSGGELIRLDISQAGPLGSKRGWKAGYPLVQWSGVL